MNEIPVLKLSDKISQEMHQSMINGEPNEYVNSHCKRDHLSPSPFDQRRNVSTYIAKHSPSKHIINYNKPALQKQLQQFRKSEDSYSRLWNLPAIQSTSQYHNAFHGHSQQKIARGKEKESWFLKSRWALDPKSIYQNNFGVKEGTLYNKQNKQRVNYNQLGLIKTKHIQRHSNYQAQFHPYVIKKEAEISIANKDHLNSKSELKNQTAISQYQRRYDSVMEVAKPKETLLSLYRKDSKTKISKPKI